MPGRTRMLLLAAAVLAVACESETEATVNYGADLSGAHMRPAVVPVAGNGTFAGTVTGGAVFAYTVRFSGLTSAATAIEIRGPAADTDTAAVLLDLSAVPATLGSGSTTLGDVSGDAAGTLRMSGTVAPGFGADSLRRLMDAGLLYVMVETANNPGGEIRGQISRQ